MPVFLKKQNHCIIQEILIQLHKSMLSPLQQVERANAGYLQQGIIVMCRRRGYARRYASLAAA